MSNFGSVVNLGLCRRKKNHNSFSFNHHYFLLCVKSLNNIHFKTDVVLLFLSLLKKKKLKMAKLDI